ncbi:MAG: hypothetical protein QOE77_485 [Blastocatellia bacterium]|nr:hypothetical protein [Blastocatellia bacterium]
MKSKIEALCVALVLTSLIAIAVAGSTTEAQRRGKPRFLTNEGFINALESSVDLKSPQDVFRFVFANLPDEVTIYPTENHYYFEFSADGKTIKGNVEISADRRDRGEIIFAYDEVNAFAGAPNGLSGAVVLSNQDGIEVRRTNPFRYELTCRGKTVAFNLNQLDQKLPHRIHLTDDEIFVGHVFDESGLKFFLVFNQKHQHLFWLLDDEAMPETLTSNGNGLLIGNRSAFAFYDDKPNQRKILIGVSQDELQRNSWYDGPFDQLPDNYIANGQVEVKKYMQAAYPYARGKINEFGIFADDPESRVAITSYRFYERTTELGDLIAAARRRAQTPSGFYCLLTDDHQPRRQ